MILAVNKYAYFQKNNLIIFRKIKLLKIYYNEIFYFKKLYYKNIILYEYESIQCKKIDIYFNKYTLKHVWLSNFQIKFIMIK